MVAFLIRVIRLGLTKNETFKQRLEGGEGNNHAVSWRKMVPGRRTSWYDGPEVRTGHTGSWNTTEPSVAEVV